MIRYFDEAEGTRKIIANLAEGNNSDMEQWIQIFSELTGLDDEQKKTETNGIRRAVEARRMDPGRANRSTGTRQERSFHGRGEGGARNARTAGEIDGE